MFVLIPIPCRFGIFCCLILSSWVPLGIQLSPLSVISFSIRPLRKHAWAWAIPFVNNKTLTAPQLKAPQQTPGKMLDSEKPEPPGHPLRSSTFGLCPMSYFSHQWGQWPGRATYKKKDFFFFTHSLRGYGSLWQGTCGRRWCYLCWLEQVVQISEETEVEIR